MKAITLEELSRIWCDYQIPRDIRAEKEINDMAFDTMQWTGWHRPECLMPDSDNQDFLLAIVSGRAGIHDYIHALVRASWNHEDGWRVLDDDDLKEFSVERWSYCPAYPPEIQKEVDAIMKGETK